MAELHESVSRINELRVKEFSGTALNDEELREVFTILADIRRMRSGKSPGASAEKIDKAALPDAEDYF